MSTLTELREPEVRERPQPQELRPQPPSSPVLGPSFFKDILLDVDPGDRKRRRWAATSSVIVQCLLLGVAVVIPLMFTEALPKAQLLTFLVVPPPPPPPPPAAAAEPIKVVKQLETDIMDGRLRSPARIPQTVQMIKEEDAPPPLMTGGEGVIGGVPGGVPGGQLGGVIGGIVNATSNLAVVPKLAKPAVQRVRISQGVTKGMVLSKPEPAYPVLARNARIQGDVVLTAVISAEGQITQLKVVSGHALLVQAAIDAVKQWRYRPFLLNGQPIEVETTVTVSFRFSS